MTSKKHQRLTNPAVKEPDSLAR
ncbi:hypothetical protein A2U01_0088717, partial [Trifolium medium]|nr:hypothetical protein [Trifolium medium]